MFEGSDLRPQKVTYIGRASHGNAWRIGFTSTVSRIYRPCFARQCLKDRIHVHKKSHIQAVLRTTMFERSGSRPQVSSDFLTNFAFKENFVKNHSNLWFSKFCMEKEVFCFFHSNGCSCHAQNLISSSLERHRSIAKSPKSLRGLVFELSCWLTCLFSCFLVFLFAHRKRFLRFSP